ncbi:MAG: NAD(P)-dependent oxidoreductase [Myxococcota bacterium]|nr:NAD(P)-dependent oxidoreductase [Myxococcota bacterium]
MSKRLLMGLDVGGGSGRCLLADADNGEVFSAASPWSYPRSGGLGFDADLDVIWRKLCDAAHQALARAGSTPDDVIGVAVTSMRFGVVVVDDGGRPLYAGPNRDARAFAESLQLANEYGDALNAQTGHWPMAVMAAPRLQWLAANDPDEWQRASTVFALNDAVTQRMCGAVATDASQAGETLLFDLASRSWADDWIERFGFPRRLFPALREPGSNLGPLASRAASDLGVRAGIPVAQGGGDTQCGLLGVGAVSDGDVAIIAGTTAPVEMVLSRPVADPDARCWQGHHLLENLWVLESSAGPAGEVLAGFARMHCPDSPRPTAALLAQAAESEPGAMGMLSTLGAQVMNARAPGLPVGSVTPSHFVATGDPDPRRHLARAVVEGIAFSMRANIEQLGELTGRSSDQVLLGGGLSQSPTFAQLLADVCAATVRAPATPEASGLGAAVCAGMAAGVYDDLRSGADSVVQLRSGARTFEPDAERSAAYEEIFAGWSELRLASAPADAVAQGLAGRALARTMSEGAASGPVAHAERPRILVTANIDERSLEQLRELGDVEHANYRELRRLLKKDKLVEALQGVDIFVTEVDLVDGASLQQLPELRIVSSCRGNAVNVDVQSCSLLGIPVLNAPGRNADAVADLTLTFMLMLARKFPAASSFLRETPHEPGELRASGLAHATLQGRELWCKTIGLIGLGAVGRGVARRVRPFGTRIIAFDPYVDAERAALDGVEIVSIDELLAESDFISLHAPVTDETRGLIGKRELERVKQGAFLINTARSALIDEQAMLEALREGRLAGAATDVFSSEPPGSDSEMLAVDNLIATPHVGGNTEEIAAHQGQIIADDLARLLRGGEPRFALNPEVARALDLSVPRAEPDADAREQLAELAKGPGPSVTS